MLEQKSALAEAPRTTSNDIRFIPVNAVVEMCGVTRITIWRWLNKPELAFPKPKKIQTRLYWDRSEVVSWLKSQGGR